MIFSEEKLYQCYYVPIWKIELNNNQIIYQERKNDWLELKDYCENNKLIIVKLQILFKNKSIRMPDNMSGYFFNRIEKLCFGHDLKLFIVVGYQVGEIILIFRYILPRLDLVEETFFISDDDNPNLIC